MQLVIMHPSQETEDAEHISFSIYSLGLPLGNAVTHPGGVFPAPCHLVIKISAHSHSQRPISQGFLGSVKLTVSINCQRQYYTDSSFIFKIYTRLVM